MTKEDASRHLPKQSGCPLDPLLNLLAKKWLVHRHERGSGAFRPASADWLASNLPRATLPVPRVAGRAPHSVTPKTGLS
jgi:hypothetical protein